MRISGSTWGAAILLGLGAGILLSSAIEQEAAMVDRPSIAAQPYPVQYLAASIAGDAADIVGTDADPDVFFYVTGADPRSDDAEQSAQRSVALDSVAGIEPRGSVNAVWLYVPNMDAMARAIVAELSDLAPGSAETFRSNADSVLAPIAGLANDFASRTEVCDVVDLQVVKPGFEHLAEGYGFRLVPGEAGPALDLLLDQPADGSDYVAAMNGNLAALTVSQACRSQVVFGP